MFGEEKELPYCGPQKPQHKGLRAKGEVITMLFCAPDVDWTDIPPWPTYWMHQLTDNWATKEKYRTGADLKNELLISIEKLLNE